jgi:hypothetical protein
LSTSLSHHRGDVAAEDAFFRSVLWFWCGLEQPLLPEGERDKAARSAGDLREHVWGTDAFEPIWCQIAVSTDSARSTPAPIGSRPVDTSLHGVCRMAAPRTSAWITTTGTGR